MRSPSNSPLIILILSLFPIVVLLAIPLSGQANPPSSFATLSAQANAARDAEHLDQAVILYKKALALNPHWAEGWWSLGTIAYDQNSYADAARAFQKVIDLAPANGTAYAMLGLSESELGRDSLALKHIEKSMALGLDKDPDLRRVVLYHDGLLLQRAGRFESAREILGQMCLQGLQTPDVETTLGMTLLRQRSKSAPVLNSEHATVVARVGHAACLASQRKFDEARSEMVVLISQHPNYPRIHYAFGVLLAEASDPTAAVSEFKWEIANNPNDLVSRLQIASSLYKVDSPAALPYAQDAVKLAPHQPFAHYLLGMLLLDTGNYEKAIPELETAQKAFPREARIYFALGSAYSQAGRKADASRARAEFQRLSAAIPKSATNADSGDLSTGKIPVKDVPAPE